MKRLRYILPFAVLVFVCTAFLGRVIVWQTSSPDIQANSELKVRTLTVRAIRGEIYDRNGNKLVSNEYSYNIYIEKGGYPTENSQINDMLITLRDKTDADAFSALPVSVSGGEYKFELPENKDERGYKNYKKMLGILGLDESSECKDFVSTLEKRYGVLDKDGNALYNDDEKMAIISARYALEVADFSVLNPYTLVEKASDKMVISVKEANLHGVEIEKNATRVYNYPGYASHILGRTGKIQSADIEYYTELGYPMDAIVGVDGAEKVFEEYLRGVDGTLVVVEDKEGNIVDEYFKKEPIAGKDVYLTIDIGLQTAAEDALEYNINYIRQTAEDTIKKETEKYTDANGNLVPWAEIPSRIGEDVSAGAATLVNPNNGEIYALASNPTFDLTTYTSDYADLLNAKNSPLYNRALMGNYEPGSTFKVGVAAAALENGIISRNDRIYDYGVYKYYDDFQPQCWIYSSYGVTHGNVNVTQAIQHSCNYFFYDVGRRLTIEKMNDYTSSLGLGQYTGIELPESKGILAGPEYRASVNKIWVPGDTVQAAIGQSDNTFTPLQISMYLSSLLNNGTRYKAHVLHSVREYGSGEIVYSPETSVMSQANLSEENGQVLKNAMKSVMENGTAAPVFANYPIEIGGKTGTAQVGKDKSNNGIFMAFAPYDNPEIVASCIIEQAGGSNEVGITIRKMFNQYFGIVEG